MDPVVDWDFAQWQVPALLVDGATRCIVATTRALQRMLDTSGESFVGVPLADVLGPDAATTILASTGPAQCRARNAHGRTVHLLARGYPSPSQDHTVALLEDMTELVLARAAAEAMAGIARAWAPMGEGVRGCAEALVLSGLCEKAAILDPPLGPSIPAVLAASGWTSDELSSILAAEATDLIADLTALPPASERAETPGGCRLIGEGASASLSVPLADEEGIVGMLLVQPAGEWLATPGNSFLVTALAEALRALSVRGHEDPIEASQGADRAALFAQTVEALAHQVCQGEPAQLLRAAFDGFMEALNKAVPFDRSALVERALGGEGVYVRAVHSPGKAVLLPPGSTYTLDAPASVQAILTGQLVTQRLKSDGAASGAVRALIRDGVTFVAAAPVACGGASRGALVLGRDAAREDFEPEELRVLRVAGGLLGCLVRAVRQQGGPRRRRRGDALMAETAQAREAEDLVREVAQGAVAYLGPFSQTIEASLSRAEQLATGAVATPIARLRTTLSGMYYVLEALAAYSDRTPDERAERMSLRSALREAMDELAARRTEEGGPGLAAYRIEHDLAVEGWILGDVYRIKAALSAALDNALAAMPEGGTLGVRLTTHGRWLRIMVSDTGVGIAPPLWDSVFLPFVSTFGVRHPGLGLSVVDGVMAKHGGVALLASDVHEGTVLVLYFPDADAG